MLADPFQVCTNQSRLMSWVSASTYRNSTSSQTWSAHLTGSRGSRLLNRESGFWFGPGPCGLSTIGWTSDVNPTIHLTGTHGLTDPSHVRDFTEIFQHQERTKALTLGHAKLSLNTSHHYEIPGTIPSLNRLPLAVLVLTICSRHKCCPRVSPYSFCLARSPV